METSYDVYFYREDLFYDEKPGWPELKCWIINACEHSKYLIVGIYDVKANRFLAIGSSLCTILGYKPHDMINEGWNFWYGLIDATETGIIRKRLSGFLSNPHILNASAIFLKYHIRSAFGQWHFIQHEVELLCHENEVLALNYICDYSIKEKIDFCLSKGLGHKAPGRLRGVTISCRETEVLKLISDGLSSKQIAAKLNISYNTAISHRKHIIEKFGVQNTAQLIKQAAFMFRL